MLYERLAQQQPSPRLTARQRDCIALVAHGLSSKEIARELGISPSTVDNHVASAMHQCGLTSRGALARWWRESESAPMVEAVCETRAEYACNRAPTSFAVLKIPVMGGIRNSLSLQERFLAIVQTMIVSAMVTSALICFVLGLIFIINFGKPSV